MGVGIRHGCGVSDSAKKLRHECPGSTGHGITVTTITFNLLSFVANFSQHISFPILGVAKFWGQFKHANLHLLSILLGATDTVTGPFVSD